MSERAGVLAAAEEAALMPEGAGVLAAAEEAAVLTEHAVLAAAVLTWQAVLVTAEEAAVTTKHVAGCCFGCTFQTACQLLHRQQAGTCQTQAAAHLSSSLCHQHCAAEIYLGVH